MAEIDLTPITHRPPGSQDIVMDRAARIRGEFVWTDENSGSISIFLNGTPTVEYKDVVNKVQESLSRNPVRYFAEQKTTRILLLNNEHGVHARDIFEDPVDPKAKFTRILLRAISRQGSPTAMHVVSEAA